MISKTIPIALALASVVSAAPTLFSRDDCQATYNDCIANGAAEVVCACNLTACLGEDSAREREYCSSATATLAQPTSTGIPGGCSPAHPGSCPSSYFTYTTATATASSETFTSIPGIPGGCNPAHPGSCPSSYFTYPTISATNSPVAVSTPVPSFSSGQSNAEYPNPVPVEGKTWTITDLIRYCSSDNSGCDYNFVVDTGDETERCTVIRMPGSDAAAESWYDQSCTAGSDLKISWGYTVEPAPPFAVITVVRGKELAWFGVANVNGQPVTASNPYGSGQYGSIGPEQVYTY
ncbi:Surface protein SP1 [Pleurostoma richardsiae]|uniref:Surface protein SP1 n=1 Tax=Pleurostoma richardsiae TaxID=41990 RepID=A0AA38VES4_9PEZI|nr:Surface protein SP1 [Pleurostoma richardsiae]